MCGPHYFKKNYNAISNDIIGPAPVLSLANGPGLRFYQLAFLTPGILPCSAMSRNIFLEIPK